MMSALAGMIPQLIAVLGYVLSLRWIADWTRAFFSALDTWLSTKLGIDPALPFFEELMKKMWGWLSADLDAAARKGKERLR